MRLKEADEMADSVDSDNLLLCIVCLHLYVPMLRRGGWVVRLCWVNFQCRGVLQFGLQ